MLLKTLEEFQKDKPDCEVSDDHKWVDMDESDNEDDYADDDDDNDDFIIIKIEINKAIYKE